MLYRVKFQMFFECYPMHLLDIRCVSFCKALLTQGLPSRQSSLLQPLQSSICNPKLKSLSLHQVRGGYICNTLHMLLGVRGYPACYIWQWGVWSAGTPCKRIKSSSWGGPGSFDFAAAKCEHVLPIRLSKAEVHRPLPCTATH